MLEQGFSFEQWVVTPADGVVSGPFGETKLEPKVMEVFVHLAGRAGEVVSRNELIDTVWRGAIVGDEVLSRCVYQVRRALGESSRDAHFLETVPKRGYRLNAAVVDIAETSVAATGHWREGSPFRGLHAFDLVHAPVFFGRARATREALAALELQASLGKNFLLLIGASGVGKSSLARAGILRHLMQPDTVPGVRRWRHDVFRPGDSPGGPLEALAAALARALGAGDVADQVRAAPGPDRLAEVLAGKLGDGERIALVADQLEEAFSTRDVSDEQRAAFFDALEALASTGLCWVIATLRSDFYPQCSTWPALMRLKKGGGQYDVRPLTPNEIRQTVVLPAQAAGLTFERDAETGQSLDDVLHDSAAAEPRLLPLLEFTLQALYDERTPDGRLTFDAYRALGGIEGSIARRADAIFAELPPAQRDALPRVLARLVRVTDARVSTASQALAEFAGEDSRALIQAFVDARLFNAELDARKQARIGITHEALLTHWPRAREWIAENREMIRVQERIADANARWEAEGRRDDLLLPRGKSLEEARALAAATGIELTALERDYIDASVRRAARRRFWERAAAAGLAGLSIVAGGAAWLAGEQRDLAVEQTAIAEREAEAAKETAEFLIDIFETADPSESTGGALTARRILDQGVARLDEGLEGQDALRTRLRALVGRAYKGIGLYGDAESLLRQAVEEIPEIEDLDDRDRLSILYELADLLSARGEWQESVAIHERVLDERLQLFGERDVDTATSLVARAHAVWRNGQVAEAEALFEKVLGIRRELLGDAHRDVVNVLSTLGTLHFQQGLRTEAAAYYGEAVSLAPSAYGARHVGTAIAISNLAAVESDPARREALLLESLSIRREVLGEEHPVVARALDILAGFYAEQDDAERAEELYLQAIDILLAGEEAIVRPTVQYHYGQFLHAQQRIAEAIAMYRIALEQYEQKLGAAHAYPAYVRVQLADAYLVAGDLRTAESVLRESLANRESAPAGDMSIANTELALARVRLAAGDTPRATELARSAAQTYEADLDQHRVSLAAALGVIAEAQLADGDTDAALANATRAVELGDSGLAWSTSGYRALAGAAMARAGDCEAGIAEIEAAFAILPSTVIAKRDRERVSDRLEAALRACGRTG